MGDLGSIPGLGRSCGEGNDYPLEYSCLENSMDCIGHGVAKSQTRLSDFHFHLFLVLQIMIVSFLLKKGYSLIVANLVSIVIEETNFM